MRDWTETTIQRDALAVKCPACLAEPGELCRYDDKILQAFPAHTKRIALANQEAAK